MAESFRQRLRQARKEAGFSQATLARAIGVKVGTISTWEHGRRLPSGTNLIGLASALEVDPVWLLGVRTSKVPNDTVG